MAEIYSDSVLNWRLKLVYTYTQNVAANSTTVTSDLYVWNDNRASNGYQNDAYYIINGTKTYYTFDYGNTKQWNHLGTKTQTVNHNADGTGSVKLSAYWYSGIIGSSYTPSSLTIAEQTIALPTIARASQFQASQISGNIGASVTIKFTVASSSFTHKLYYKIGSEAEVGINTSIAAGTTQVNWTIPTSFYAKIPSATSLSGTLKLYTYSGSTLIGVAASIPFTANCVENSCKPTVSITLAETNTTVNNLTNFASSKKVVKGYSQIQATVTATAQNSASINARTITYGKNTQNYTEPITYTNINSGTWSATATDSRGYTTTATKNDIALIEYYKPSITCSVFMLLQQNDTTKANATITASTNYWVGSFGAQSNSVTTQYRYKVSNGSFSSWTTFSGSVTVSNLNAASTYVFQTRATDKLETVNSYQVTATALPIFDFDSNDFNFNTPVNINAQPLTVQNCPVITTGGSNAEIPANADLNSYKNAGVYSCGMSANAKTLSNTPWGNQSNNAIAFVMFVWYSVGATNNTNAYSYIVQELRTYDGEFIYKRHLSTSGSSTWNSHGWHLSEAPIVDRIVNRGTSNGLNYALWSSGKAEAWGVIETTITTTSNQSGWYVDLQATRNFPTSTYMTGSERTIFVERPCVTITPQAGAYTQITLGDIWASTYRFYAITAWAVSNQTVYLHVHVVGRWK